MIDQAKQLRGLVRQQQDRQQKTDVPRRAATSIAVVSGKGGVGKSSLALNLAIALSRLEARTCIFDANLGLGNIDLMCGLNGYWNLAHVIAGLRRLPDILLEGPGGIHVVPGAGGLSETLSETKLVSSEFKEQMYELESNHDVLVFDTGAGLHPLVHQCVAAADTVLVITTPEPTAIADAYATIKSLQLAPGSRLLTLVNRATTARQARDIHERLARTTRLFLETTLLEAGWVPEDPEVLRAINHRIPVLIETPDSPASRAIEQLARRLFYQTVDDASRTNFFGRLWPLSKTRAA